MGGCCCRYSRAGRRAALPQSLIRPFFSSLNPFRALLFNLKRDLQLIFQISLHFWPENKCVSVSAMSAFFKLFYVLA